jgi:hypothetical protein
MRLSTRVFRAIIGVAAVLGVVLAVPGCTSTSLGPERDAAEGMKGFTQVGTRTEGGFEVNYVDAQMVQMPKVTAVRAQLVYANSAVIEWETDIEADGYVEYGLSEVYGVSSPMAEGVRRQHRAQLEGLSAGTEYSFRVVASRHGLEAARVYSANYKFQTPTF